MNDDDSVDDKLNVMYRSIDDAMLNKIIYLPVNNHERWQINMNSVAYK